MIILAAMSAFQKGLRNELLTRFCKSYDAHTWTNKGNVRVTSTVITHTFTLLPLETVHLSKLLNMVQASMARNLDINESSFVFPFPYGGQFINWYYTDLICI